MEKECDIVKFSLSQYLVLTNKWYWIQFMRYSCKHLSDYVIEADAHATEAASGMVYHTWAASHSTEGPLVQTFFP